LSDDPKAWKTWWERQPEAKAAKKK
jgi:hypothetical protein